MIIKHFCSFSGYGGFTIPMEEFGIETIGFSEVDKYANSLLRYRFPDIRNYGDVTGIKENDLPWFNLLTGGSPCQDLSIAGTKKGLNGARSGLFFQFIRLLKEKQPEYFVWENVKNALSSNRGWDFARVLIEFCQAGYDVQWQVLNSKNFGVPHNRERVFIVGNLRGKCGREIFPIGRKSGESIRVTGQDVPHLLDLNYPKGPATKERYDRRLIDLTKHNKQRTRVYDSNGISRTLKALSGGYEKTGLYWIHSRQTDRNGDIKKYDNKSYCLDTSHGGGQTIELHNRVRRLTPIECERLQGLDDNWTKYGIDENGVKFPISDNQRYKLCGNGVTVNVVREIIKRMFGKE